MRAQRTGLVSMGVFTGAWSMLGLVSGVLPLQITSCALIVAAIYFVIRSIRSTRADARAQTDRRGSERGPRLPAPSDSRFVVAVAAESVAIAVTVIVMLRLHLPQYVVPLVALIVGTHFFIFIRPGDRVVHVIAGTAGVIVGLAGIALIAAAVLEPIVVRGIVGCCFAIITAYYGCYFLTWRFSGTAQEESAG